MPFVPAMANGGRWNHIASEREVKRALMDKSCVILEAPMIGITFLVSRRWLTTLRASAGGGDTFEVEGGWVYANDLAQRLDEREIKRVAEVATL